MKNLSVFSSANQKKAHHQYSYSICHQYFFYIYHLFYILSPDHCTLCLHNIFYISQLSIKKHNPKGVVP